jgi:hypothetical protein
MCETEATGSGAIRFSNVPFTPRLQPGVHRDPGIEPFQRFSLLEGLWACVETVETVPEMISNTFRAKAAVRMRIHSAAESTGVDCSPEFVEA